jgi:Na+/H+-dicarboxylate symporter
LGKTDKTGKEAAHIEVMCAAFGIPSGGQLLTWPLLMSAGIPIEALVMLKVADAIPDIFKTVLNVTADMSVATIVERFSHVEATPSLEIAGAA